MQALLLDGIGVKMRVRAVDDPVAGADEVVVQLYAAALNRRDYWITQGKYPGLRFPAILGSDGAGTLEGRAVVINPGLRWGDNQRVQSSAFRVLGMPDPGTFAQRIALPADHVYDKPAHLSWEEAAALPLAGLTAYRALFVQGMAQPGQRVLISGAGGGVALIAIQFALALGMEVWVTSGSDEKIGRAQGIGIAGGVNYRKDDWPDQLKQMAGSFDLVIDSAGGDGFAALVSLVAPGGRLVTYGGSLGKVNKLSPQLIFWRQITIQGSTMGSQSDFRGMLNFVNQHQIRPVVDRVFDLVDGQAAIDYLARGEQFGKVVLNIPQ
ncbi:MAG: zinc-binding dehydrogenase [Saprospiraceae bacterium]|nr:zinc-binding dehydrogenase [Saprospiraceae bacterium]